MIGDFVYCLSNPATGLLKIGFSRNEQAIMKRFSADRVAGEWFRDKSEIRSVFESHGFDASRQAPKVSAHCGLFLTL